jgi:hypothetical protein
MSVVLAAQEVTGSLDEGKGRERQGKGGKGRGMGRIEERVEGW